MKPRIFIGSSSENLAWAEAIQVVLSEVAEVTVWNQSIIPPGITLLASLKDAISQTDFAVLVCLPDDQVTKRGKRHGTTRDNVIFELGFAFAAIGAERCFVFTPKADHHFKLPSDLAEVIVIPVDIAHANRRAAATMACQDVKAAIKKLSGVTAARIPIEAVDKFSIFCRQITDSVLSPPAKSSAPDMWAAALLMALNFSQEIVNSVWPGEKLVLSLKTANLKDKTTLRCRYLPAKLDGGRIKSFNGDAMLKTIPIAGSAAGLAFVKQDLVVIEDYQADRRIKRDVKKLLKSSVRSVVACPVYLCEKPFGAIKLDAKRKGFFRESDPIVEATLGMCSQMFGLAASLVEAQRSKTRRKKRG